MPLQTLVDGDGQQKPVLRIILEEALRAGVQDICVVVCPGDEEAYRQAAGPNSGDLQFVAQTQPRGYGHAVYCAREFVAGEAFLHMVGDHIYVSSPDGAGAAPGDGHGDGNRDGHGDGDRDAGVNGGGSRGGCARQLVEVAERNNCAVSGVQSTREHLLPYFGTVGGARVAGAKDLYLIERVAEKPTPTEAEQSLLVPGLRAGHYLCFFGIHVLTPAVLDILAEHLQGVANEANLSEEGGDRRAAVQLSPVLNELARRERYLAYETRGRRYPIDVRYGLLTAQLALALSGRDREEVLAGLCELLAQRELGDGGFSRSNGVRE